MKKENGFLLVELLITLALLTILLPPLLGLLQTGTKLLSGAKQQTKALYLAVECLENIRTQHFCNLKGMHAQPVDDFPEYLYAVQVKELEQIAGNLPLKEICVEVYILDSHRKIRLITWQTWR